MCFCTRMNSTFTSMRNEDGATTKTLSYFRSTLTKEITIFLQVDPNLTVLTSHQVPSSLQVLVSSFPLIWCWLSWSQSYQMPPASTGINQKQKNSKALQLNAGEALQYNKANDLVEFTHYDGRFATNFQLIYHKLILQISQTGVK